MHSFAIYFCILSALHFCVAYSVSSALSFCREVDSTRWFPVAFLTSCVFIVTRAGLEFLIPLLRALINNLFGIFLVPCESLTSLRLVTFTRSSMVRFLNQRCVLPCPSGPFIRPFCIPFTFLQMKSRTKASQRSIRSEPAAVKYRSPSCHPARMTKVGTCYLLHCAR